MKNTFYRLLLLPLLLVAWGAQAQAPIWLSANGVPVPGGDALSQQVQGIATNAAGDIFVTGSYSGTATFTTTTGTTTFTSRTGPNTGQDLYVAKWSTANSAWAWAITGGSDDGDVGTGIAVSGNNVYVTGVFGASTPTFNGQGLTSAGGTDIFVAKLIDGGNTVTNASVLTGGGASNDRGTAIAVNGNNVYMTGYINGAGSISGTTFTSGAGSQDIIVAKFVDAGGVLTNGGALRAGSSAAERGTSIAVNGTNVYVGAYFNGATATFGNNTSAPFGTTTLTNASTTSDAILIKYTDTGSLSFSSVVQAGGTDIDRINAVAVNGSSVYVSGFFSSASITFGSSTLTNAASGSPDVFVAKYTDSGTLTSNGAVRGGGTGDDTSLGLAVIGSAVYATGYFTSPTATFGSSVLTVSGGADVFLAKYTDAGGLSLDGAIRGGSAGAFGADGGSGIAITGTQVVVGGSLDAVPATFGSYTISSSGNGFFARAGVAQTTVTSITTTTTSPTNASSISYTVTFAASVAGLTTSNFSLSPTVTGASISSVSGSGTTYTVVVNTGTGSGTLQLNLANATGLTPSVSNVPYAGPSLTIDKTAPTVVISSTAGATGSSTGTTPIPFTATFSEAVTGFGASDVTVTNGSITGGFVNGSGTTYTFTVTPTTAGTATTVSVLANGAQDAAGNGNAGAPPYSITYTPPALVLAPSTLPNGTVGAAYSQTITASNGTAPYTFAISAGALPAGFTLTSAGVLAGTPTAGGSFSFTIRATDNIGTTGSRAYTLTIAAPTITVAPATLPSGTQSTAYSQTITASGGTAPYSYAITSGSLPSGLTLSSAGTLSGTPTTNGSFTFTVTATDASTGSGPYTGSRSYTLIIAAPAATTVVSVTRLTPSPTATAQVSYRVVFANSVTGITVSNFTTTNSGTIVTGSNVSSVSGSGTTYTVTVNTGTGNGTLRLDVANSTGISPTVSNVPYTAGEVYTITKSFAANPQLTVVGTGGTGSDVTAFVDVVQVLSGGSFFANGLQNSSFETHDPLANGDFGYTPTGATWTFNSQSGIAESGSAFTPTTPIPNGIAVAFVQSNSGGNGQLQQNLALPTGSSYQVSFQAAQRVCCTTLDQSLNVFLNGVFIGNIQPNSNGYTAFTSATFAVTAPALTASISSTAGASGSTTATSPIPFAVTFSQGVTGFIASDVTVTGGTLSGFTGSGATYTFNVTPSASGTITVNVPANSAVDGNNTGNSAATFNIIYAQPVTAAPVVTTPNGFVNTSFPTYSGTAAAGSLVTVYVNNTAIGTTTATGTGTWNLTQPTRLADGSYTVYATAQSSGSAVSANSNTNTFVIDTVSPTVTIASSSAPNGGTSSTSPLAYTVTFSETVTGFVAGDVTIGNGTIAGFSGSGTTYTFNVTPSANGTVTVDVPANVAQDRANNGNNAASQYRITYAQLVTATPVVTAPANGSLLSTTTPTYSGTAPAGSTVTVYVDGASIGTTTATGGSFSLVQASALAQGSHTVYATAQTSGSAVSANSATNTFTVDTVSPTVAISSSAGASGGSTPTSPIPFAVTFSEAVTGFVAGDVTVTNGTISGFTGSGANYSFNVTPTTVNTATTVTVAASAAQDAAGNGNTASSTFSLTYTVTLTSWTGAVSTDWFTSGNWTAGVPTATIDATIPANVPNYPLITAGTAQVRSLTANSGVTLTQTGGTLNVTGDLTNNGTLALTGGTVALGSTTQSSILGSGSTRFWNLMVGANGAQLSTSAGTSVQRVATLNGSFATQGNPFILESNSTSTAMLVNNGSNVVSGNVTVQRYITPDLNPNLGYRHFSSAISTATVASLATGSFAPVVNPAYNTSATPATVRPFPTVYGYDQSRLATATNNLPTFDKGWFSPSALSDGLTVGQGYTVNLAANQTLSLTGPQNNGNVPLTLSRNSGATAADAGLALVGNPYPSPLDWSLVVNADRPNLDGVIYVFASNDPANPYAGSYSFYNNGIGNASPVLPLGQGFFVRVTAGQTAATLTLKNSHRPTAYSNNTYHRNAAETRPLVQLTLRGTVASTVSDDAFVYFENGATNSFEAQYDAEKLVNSSGLNLSTSLSATQHLSIDGRGVLGTSQQVVPLAVGVPAVGSYTLTAAQLLNLSTVPVYLRDLQTGALIDLALQPSYQFTVSNASALLTGRFELFFSPQQPLATVPATLAQQVALYPNPATTSTWLALPTSLGRQAVTATLLDAVGREVRTLTLPAQGAVVHQLDLHQLATGIYALRLHTSAGVVVKKLVVE